METIMCRVRDKVQDCWYCWDDLHETIILNQLTGTNAVFMLDDYADEIGTRFDVNVYVGLETNEQIFTNDILILEDAEKDCVYDSLGPSHKLNHFGVVKFEKGSFGVEVYEDGYYFEKGFYAFPIIEGIIGDLNLLQVVGNIYDNEDLLKAS